MSFIEYIESGNLEKSKEYLKDNPEYDIHADNEYAFRRSCYYGHLEAAKWLYELDGKIDIHANNDMAFRWSCEKGYIEIAKWLYGLDGKINIHAENEEALRKSCKNGYMEVAVWLYELDNEYYNKWIIENNIENEILMDKIMDIRMKESRLYIGEDVEISI